ncbi:hypothetical protein LAUMK191_02804 [Mycobacterium attenuatum]|nr:hypothetical protein LAUMK191_02804 [Mycobacterium attenuatum]VBA58284.1 hypothetical protein LAUMK41_02881 [Mycobacterium attenuatum]
MINPKLTANYQRLTRVVAETRFIITPGPASWTELDAVGAAIRAPTTARETEHRPGIRKVLRPRMVGLVPGQV